MTHRCDALVRRSLALATLATIAVGVVAAPARAQDHFRGWEQIKDPGFTADPDRREFRSYQVGRAPQVRELLEKYETLLAERAVVPALRRLQELLDDHGASVLQVAKERYVGAAEYARWLLMHAPPELRTAYERLAELNGRSALETARADGDDFTLRSLARRYANARVGQEALLALARLHRERGERRVAAYHARRLLDFTSSPAPGEEARTAAIATEARAIAALCEGTLAGISGNDAAAGAPIAVAGREEPLAQLLAQQKLEPPTLPADVWPTYGGDASRSRRSVAPLREIVLSRSFELPVEHQRYQGSFSPLSGMKHEPVQPIRIGDRLFVNNSLSVKCYDLLTRSPVWEFEGLQARIKGRDEDGFLAVTEYDPENPMYDDQTWSKALVVGLSAAEGIVLANLQVPQAANVKKHQGFKINDPCRWRGLVALDQESGELLWEQRPLVRNSISGRLEYPELRRRGDQDGVLPRLDVPAPPAIVDDVVFALGHFFEGAINTYLVALDLKDGEPLWSVPLVIGQQELSMFNMPFQEFTTGCPSFWNGTLFCPTNVGLVAAVDATFGDLRWLAAYDALKIEPPDNYFKNRPRPVYWHNRGPVVGDDLLIVTPHDSMQILSLDPSTGKERFARSMPVRGMWYPTSQLLGIVANRAIVATYGIVVALSLDDGRVMWQYPDSQRNGGRPVELLGTGAVTDDYIFLPTLDELVVLDAKGAQVDRRSWDPDESRSVLVFSDMLIAASKSDVLVAFDPAEALVELRAELLRRGESLELLSRIGSLERQAGELSHAIETLRRALELAQRGPPTEVARVRAALCATLCETAEQERKAGRMETAEAALVAAEAVADDAESRARIVQQLLERHAADAQDARALRWLVRLRDDFAAARVSVPDLSPRPLTVAIWVGLELARRHERRGELDQALAELQRLQTDWPAEPLAERDSVALAQAAVEALLARAPAELRARYDDEALAAFSAAVAANDAERLALLLRRFPSAASAPQYAAKELELLRTSRRPVDALEIGAELLRAQPSAPLVRAATIELARAARDVGNVSLARALARRLAVAPEGVLPDDLRSIADPVDEPRPTSVKLDLLRQVAIEESSSILGGGDRTLRGEPLARGLDSIYVYEPGVDARIVRIHLPDGERVFAAKLPRPRTGELSLQVLHVAGALVARRGSLLVAFDAESGDELWRKELESDVPDFTTAAGVLIYSNARLPTRDAGESEPIELTFVEPRTGRELATATLSGTNAFTGQLVGVGATCIATSRGRGVQAVEAFDAATGARLLDPRIYQQSAVPPLLLAQSDLLLLPDAKPSPGELGARSGGVQRLNAFRIGSGEKAFDFDLLPLSYRPRQVYGVAEGFAVLGGTQPNAAILVVDPRSGQQVGPPAPLPKEILETTARVLVAGEEQMVRVQGFGDWRLGEATSFFALLEGGGRELWRKAFELPKSTTTRVWQPDRMIRHGSALLLALQYLSGGKWRTDLIVVDEGSGDVLDRQGFDGGRQDQRNDLVRAGDFVVLRHQKTIEVLGWR